MKSLSVISAAVVLGLVSCDTMNRPITSGDFDPLRPPGSESSTAVAAGPVFKAGQFVRATMDNTAFFKNHPKGDSDADKLLSRGTSMKVVSTSDSYVKVELDSGEIGFVPAIMVEDPKAVSGVPVTNPGEFQVYPPVGGYSGLPPSTPPAEQPPGGAIPTVIDPEAPATVVPKTEPAPLPPNGEEPDAGKNTQQ